MAADGSIVIETQLDDRQAQAELNRLTKKINSLQETIMRAQTERLPLVEQAAELGARLDEAKAKLYEMQNAPIGSYSRENIDAQAESVKTLQAQWNVAQGQVERYDRQIEKAASDIDYSAQKAGELAEQLADSGTAGNEAGEKISLAMQKAGNSVAKIGKRILGLMKRVLFFSVITMALRSIRSWLTNIIKTDEQAVKSLNKLKAAILTFAQPLVNKIIPAAQILFDVLTKIFTVLADISSRIFGTTKEKSLEAAQALYDEQRAIDGVGKAADKTSKKLLSFDEINQLNKGSAQGSAESTGSPDFEALNEDFLNNTFEGLEKKVTMALLLGGVALIAFGAATKKLGLVLSGLSLLGGGIAYGDETEVLDDWAHALGLERVESLVTLGLLLAGLAALVAGIVTGRILLILSAAALIGASLVYGEKTETFAFWAEKLGLDKAQQYITPALLVAGMAALVIGIIIKQPLLALSGASILGAGIVYGAQSGTFSDWAKALGLDSVFGYVQAGILLAGIALIVFGIKLSQLWMVITGIGLLAVDVIIGAIGEEKLKDWWETLKLTRVEQWIGVALSLGGIALVVFGAATANWLALILGLGLLAVANLGTLSSSEGSLNDWIKTLGLEKVAGWVATAMQLGGIGLIVFGIASGNAMWVIAGLGLLGASIPLDVAAKKTKWDIEASLAEKGIVAPGTTGGAANKREYSDIDAKVAELEELWQKEQGLAIAEGTVTPANQAFSSGQTDAQRIFDAAFAAQQKAAESAQKKIVLEVDGHEFGSVVVDAYNTESQRVGVALD